MLNSHMVTQKVSAEEELIRLTKKKMKMQDADAAELLTKSVTESFASPA